MEQFGIGQTAAAPTGPRPQPTMPSPGLDQPIAPDGRTWEQEVKRRYTPGEAMWSQRAEDIKAGRHIERRVKARRAEQIQQNKAGWDKLAK